MELGKIHKQLRLIVFRDAEKAAFQKGEGTVTEVGFPDLAKINPGEYKAFTTKQKKIVSNKLQGLKRLSEEGYQAVARDYQENKHALGSLTALLESLAMSETEHDETDGFETDETASDEAGHTHIDDTEGRPHRARFHPSILRNSPSRSPTRSPPHPSRSSTRPSSRSPPPHTATDNLGFDLDALTLDPPLSIVGSGTLEDPFIMKVPLDGSSATPIFTIHKGPVKSQDNKM